MTTDRAHETERADDIERAMRDADAANGEPDALDRRPDDGERPSDREAQAERQPDDADADAVVPTDDAA
jgi:hypothetical protein